MRKIEIKMTGITDLKTDAIVNAANSGLWAGSGGRAATGGTHTKFKENRKLCACVPIVSLRTV